MYFFYKMGHIGAVALFREEIMNPQFFVCVVTFKILFSKHYRRLPLTKEFVKPSIYHTFKIVSLLVK